MTISPCFSLTYRFGGGRGGRWTDGGAKVHIQVLGQTLHLAMDCEITGVQQIQLPLQSAQNFVVDLIPFS